MIRVRPMRPGEGPRLYALYHRAVHEGAAGAYTAAERAAWVPTDRMPADWPDRLTGQITVVAEADGPPLGFMTLGRDGHLDLAFVLPEAMGTGAAAALHDRLLSEAGALGLTRLDTEASHLARRFLLKQGWTLLAAQQVQRRGQSLTNFRMEKRVSPAQRLSR
jgi:putative acetyltransferase